jgi:5-methyltetrahydrofolate--homocysteine methyltransferase
MLERLKAAVIEGNIKRAKRITEQIVDQEIPSTKAIRALMSAMKVVGDRYERKEFFLVEVASSASAMRESFKVLEPHLEVAPASMKGKIVIGSLKGNIQNLGKDIVVATLRSANLTVVDLGVDVAPEEFVQQAKEDGAKIIAVSVSMEETVPFLKDIVEVLRREKLRDQIKVVIGGNAVSENIRKEYGLDAYAVDARDCLEKVQALLA